MRLAPALSALLLALPAAAQEADGPALFAEFCASCHGTNAMGDGPMAGMLTVPPPDLTRIAERGGGFDRFAVAARIDGRDPLLAHGGPMPVWGGLFEGRDVAMSADSGQPIMTSAPIKALVEYLEAIQRRDG